MARVAEDLEVGEFVGSAVPSWQEVVYVGIGSAGEIAAALLASCSECHDYHPSPAFPA